MIQNLLNDHRILHAGNDPHRPLALLAGFDVDIEYPFQPLGPGHGGMTFRRCLVVRVGFFPGLLAPLTPPSGSDQRPVLAVGGEYPMKSCEVDSRLGYQGRQPGNKIQRLKDHMSGAVAKRGLQFIAHLATRGEGEALL